jgi:hypothetical protein
MIMASQIRDVVQRYISGEFDADSFVSKFSELSYNIHKRGTDEAISLRNGIESMLADVYAHIASVQQLRERLEGFVFEKEMA